MKREERHKLHRNELADWIEGVIERVKPYFNTALLVVLLVGLVIGALIWWARRSAAQEARRWQDVQRAWLVGSPAELEAIVRQYPDSDAALWAAVLAGNLHLSNGCQALFHDEEGAVSELQRAIDLYGKVQEESKVPTLVQQATFGLARAYEAMAGTPKGRAMEAMDKADELYEQLEKKWPNGAYAEVASRRLEDLSRQETRAFYDRFATIEREPPPVGVPGMPPGLSDELNKDFEEGTFSSESVALPDQESPKTQAAASAEASSPKVASDKSESPEPKEAAPPPPTKAKPGEPAPDEPSKPQGKQAPAGQEPR